MIIEWLFIIVLVLAALDLIVLVILGILIFKKVKPILEQELNKKYKDKEWLDLMNEWLNDAYHAYPDSKPGLFHVKKQLRKQKEEI